MIQQIHNIYIYICNIHIRLYIYIHTGISMDGIQKHPSIHRRNGARRCRRSAAIPCHCGVHRKSQISRAWARQHGSVAILKNWMILVSLGIQTLSEKVPNPPNHSKLYPKHFRSEGTWIPRDRKITGLPEAFPQPEPTWQCP